jgi:thiosulfate/3-mercaptopyruvate sulfurtransferase
MPAPTPGAVGLVSALRGGSLGTVNTSRPDAALPGSLVSTSWLASQLGPPLVVLDATVILPPPGHDGDYRPQSGSASFAAGHIPGARHADLLGEFADHTVSYHFARPSPNEFAAALGRLGVADGCPVVTYDSAGGVWAERLWWMLRWIGVPAAVLDGGWPAWVSSGGAVESGAPDTADPEASQPRADDAVSSRQAALTPRERPGMWADRSDVAEIVRGSRPGHLVCTLPADVFAGTAPTRYARRGHIPSSLSLPARTLLGPDGRMRPFAELEHAVAAIPDDGNPVTVYCGGGISAATVAHALSLVGREQVAIYDGSLEEWAADRALPLELGS